MPHHSPISRNRGYLDSSSHSPVPSLTNDASRSSSVSSSVNSLSPDTLVTTPRDLMPQFKSTAGCAADMDKQGSIKRALSDDDNVDACSSPHKRRGEISGDNTGTAADTKKRSLAYGDSGSVDDGVPHKRRRESSSDDTEPTTPKEQGNNTQVGDMERKAKRRDAEQPRKRKPLTGNLDFVKKFGLAGLYQEFVRPYVGETRQQLPDLASAYLKNVKGSVHRPGAASLDLLGLVMAPPKNEFDSLDLLPMASIKAAFNIGTRPGIAGAGGDGSDGHKRSRISLKMSTDSQTPSPSHHQQRDRQPHNSVKQ
ncbi:hypothetical protein GGI22_003051 [Coemansia erecta]|nr:hypothetical protein GGI22_003051 [Coemansia erecta]